MTLRVLPLCVVLAAMAACTADPYPRGTAYQGVPAPAKDAPSPYYLGADPDFRPHGSRGP
jgi:hypothetical protein